MVLMVWYRENALPRFFFCKTVLGSLHTVPIKYERSALKISRKFANILTTSRVIYTAVKQKKIIKY